MEDPNEPWRRNMWLIWIAMFVMNAGFSLIMPFLPLYIQQMGVQGKAVEIWTGVIFAANFITGAFALPLWGRVADRYGRRPMMIRAGISVGVIVALTGLATNPWQVLLLRLLLGTSIGFMPAATAYMTSITPKDRMGYMLGILQTSGTVGTILGPFIGGILASFMRYRYIFFVNGAACLVSAAVAIFLVREKFTPVERKDGGGRLTDDLKIVAANTTLLSMMVVVMVQQFSVMNSEPIISLYLRTLHVPAALLEFLSGAVFSIVGVADVFASPLLGRRGDRIGYKKVLMICLGGVAVAYTLQGMATVWWHLMLFRFVQGCFVGGVLASANALTSLSSSRSFQGRAFAVSNSAMMVGNFAGPLVGGVIAAWFGYRSVFPITGALCLANMYWVYRGVKEERPQTEEFTDLHVAD